MGENISHAELFRIINRAVAGCANHKNIPVNTEISIFRERYAYRLGQNRQLDIFEATLPQNKELADAVDFCDNLEAYRQATDIDAKENDELEEWQCRRIYKGIERYRRHISPENLAMLNILEYNIKRRLPEYRELLLLEEYNREACRIHDLKLGYNRRRRQNQSVSKDYEWAALGFFKEVLHDENLKKIKGCPEKLALYMNSLRIVDCLPAEKYNRTAKFKLKYDLNYAVKITAETLSQAESDFQQAQMYTELAQKAGYEQKRYLTAIERINFFKENKSAHDSSVAGGTSSPAGNKSFRGKQEMSVAARNKRAYEEWLYR